MRFVDNGNITDPRLNLALEEFLLRQVQTNEPLCVLYVNEPSVIVGRNQNVFEEVNTRYIKDTGVALLRRLSGGGTVYHDLGNLNYSFITPGQANLHRFDRVTEPIIRTLRGLGVAAEFRERSDIVVGEKKISGNAQYASKGRLLSHGTLLFDADLKVLNEAIKADNGQIESRAVPSNRSMVGNIHSLLPAGWRIDDFKEALLTGIFGPGDLPVLPLKDGDWAQIKRIAVDRYGSWAWNIGRSPRFSLTKSARLFGSRHEVRIEVEKGVIKGIEGSGRFFDARAILVLNQTLQGIRYDPDDILAALHPLENDLFFGLSGSEAFVSLLY